jgi:hypothetical protein
VRIGEPVRILISAPAVLPDHLGGGTVAHVELGQVGLYAGGHRNQTFKADGWHWVHVVINDQLLWVQLHVTQMRTIDDEQREEGLPPAELGLPDTTEEKRGER